MNKLKQTCKRKFPIAFFVYPTKEGARGKFKAIYKNASKTRFFLVMRLKNDEISLFYIIAYKIDNWYTLF